MTDKYDLGQIVKSWVSSETHAAELFEGSPLSGKLLVFLFQGGVLWDIQGEGQDHNENVHV